MNTYAILAAFCAVVWVASRFVSDSLRCKQAQVSHEVRKRIYGRDRYPFHRDR